MQSAGGGGGYGGGGGVSEMQQLMIDAACCPPSLFSNTTATIAAEIPPPPPPPHPIPPHHRFPYHPFHHLPPPPPASPPLHFAHLGHHQHFFPITQQLFNHHPHHFNHHPIQHQQQIDLGLDHQESDGPETSNSSATIMGGAPSFLTAMNFKLAVNDAAAARTSDNCLNDDGSETNLHRWHRQTHQDHCSTAITKPFWRPLDIDYNINPNNKRDKQPADQEADVVKHLKFTSNHEAVSINTTTDSNYKLFSELEAIYQPGAATNNNNHHQTGSDSALTGGDEDDNPLQLPTVAPGHGNASDTSNHGDPSKNFQKTTNRKRSKQRRQQHQQLSSIAGFFDSLLQRLMDHQEGLHRNFLDAIEKREKERTEREEAWRKQESAKASREAAARAHERAQSAARESAIISFLEKITGEPFNHPFDHQQQMSAEKDIVDGINAVQPYREIQLGSRRWPRAEVQALIRVRSGLETRFQEPGLKGPLWEEASKGMGRMGYSRSSKRCKEKWENINKYFRKTKDSGKKRPRQSKTCPYFHELDQLYSKSSNTKENNNSQLLDAVVEPKLDGLSSKFGEDEQLRVECDEVNNEEEEEEEEEESQDHDCVRT